MTKTLVIVHAGLASATRCPELMIDEEEGKLLANASVNLMQQFDLTPDPKTQAIIGAVMAAGMVYGPRAVMIRARLEQQKREQAATPETGGVGQAGVYAPNGAPMGTTEYKPN